NNQSATAGTAVGVAPSVLVKDANNNPVSGISVTFAVASGGGTTTGATQTTNSVGIAQVTSWTLGKPAGTNTLTATATGVAGAPVTFTATGTAGPAAQIALVDGSTTGTAGLPVANPPRVIVKDANDNPVAGVAVSFAVASGGGSISGAAQTTNTSGIAAVPSWTLGTIAGTNTMTATATGLTGSPLTITAVSIAGPPAKLAFLTQPSNTGWRVYAPTIVVALEDQYGNVAMSSVAPVTLSLLNNPGSASLTGGEATAPVNGLASFSSVTLNQPGSGYTLSATTSMAGVSAASSAPFDVSPTAIVASWQSPVIGLTVVDSAVVFTSAKLGGGGERGDLVSAPKMGGTAIVRGSTNVLASAGRVLADGAGVATLQIYRMLRWDSGIIRAAAGTWTQTVLWLGSDYAAGPDLEFDGVNFYTVATADAPPSSPGIVRVRASDGSLFNLTPGIVSPFAVDGGQLYFKMTTGTATTIERMSVNGGPSTTVVTGVGGAQQGGGWRSMLVVNGTLYWSEAGTGAGSGSIRSVPVSGGVATIRASGLSTSLQNMNSDGVSLYVNDGGSLRRFRLSDFSMTTIAANDAVGDIALDAEAVYWASNITNAVVIKKAPK
ncbi:MAG: hypothetical protein M3Z18_00955, partial [Gemmatimonadota bacterium]|nr:hypothetical protein [Gemmatimonadota bacterium]